MPTTLSNESSRQRRLGKHAYSESVSWADVVLEGSDTSAKAALHSVGENLPTDPNRGRVHVCISPFGATGPWQSRDANEFTLQGWSGKLVTNYAGPADRPPAAAGGEAGLWLCGTFAAVGALAFHRLAERTGRSVRVDTSTLEAMVAVFGSDALAWQLEGFPTRPVAAAPTSRGANTRDSRGV